MFHRFKTLIKRNLFAFPEGPERRDKSPENISAVRMARLGYLCILLIIILLYMLSIPVSIHNYTASPPFGDNESFITYYFGLINSAEKDYLGTLSSYLNPIYFRTHLSQILLTILISPALVNEPFSIMVINFIAFGMAVTMLYRLAVEIGVGPAGALIVALIPWLYPTMYGNGITNGYFSFLALNIDVFHYSLLIASAAAVISLVLKPESIFRAFLALGVCFVAILSRHNGGANVAFVILIPCMALLFSAFLKRKHYRDGPAFSISLLAPLLLAAFAIYQSSVSISNYYGPVFATKAFELFNFHRISSSYHDYKNILDILIVGSHARYIPTIISHLIVFAGLTIAFFSLSKLNPTQRTTIRILALTGACVFYGTFVILICILGIRLFYNSTHGFLPVLVGLSLSSIALIVWLFLQKHFFFSTRKTFALPLVVIAFLSYGAWWERALEIRTYAGPSPRDIEEFATSLDYETHNENIAWLWFGRINRSVINYYRLKEGLPQILEHSNEYRNDLWLSNPSADLKRIELGIRKSIEKADFLVILEHPIAYQFFPYPYPFNLHPEQLIKVLNDPSTPALFICKRIPDLAGDGFINVLLLQVKKPGKKTCSEEQLRKPYGPTISEGDNIQRNMATGRPGLISILEDDFILAYDKKFFLIPKTSYIPSWENLDLSNREDVRLINQQEIANLKKNKRKDNSK